MLPLGSGDNVPDLRCADVVFACQGRLGSTVAKLFSNLKNLFFCEFRLMMLAAPGHFPVDACMPHVLKPGHVFKVLDSIVCLVAVFMVDFVCFRRWGADECACHQSMGMHDSGSIAKVDRRVPRHQELLENSGWDKPPVAYLAGEAFDSSLVGNLVFSFESGDGSPLFGYAVFSHARGPFTGNGQGRAGATTPSRPVQYMGVAA